MISNYGLKKKETMKKKKKNINKFIFKETKTKVVRE
jgi:hypothetical protein